MIVIARELSFIKKATFQICNKCIFVGGNMSRPNFKEWAKTAIIGLRPHEMVHLDDVEYIFDEWLEKQKEVWITECNGITITIIDSDCGGHTHKGKLVCIEAIDETNISKRDRAE